MNTKSVCRQMLALIGALLSAQDHGYFDRSGARVTSLVSFNTFLYWTTVVVVGILLAVQLSPQLGKRVTQKLPSWALFDALLTFAFTFLYLVNVLMSFFKFTFSHVSTK